ncbi:PDR/VanB family oxidoreductase [Halomonas sp. McH1-25]|uniref:PDR/VanB family oxidoreductase n=1 Tax=unclassified Halomonas TaxID=2609666 RepID=UPI001EF40003|nr:MULTISPECIES: PDR/VanB family oxidoreductase [unclassified Halomonas]MCG7601291.1 PDR/VanB family oxidoreductase [Halomonas sp. McH1-25]MCP1343258.1 PDR/VanB family oxidoreductase [Halomonas sp. FL8]MCP1360751.1 PDR/VanB family oxidoreductase [Halomonas sp. BBD45]MCP1364530.1 PDR/VanB family oxidoreductase [Halomonas sp. BBD48]
MSNSTLSLFVRVTKKAQEAEDIVSFELTDPHGRPLPAFSAGAHVDVRIRDGLIRQYSLCNHPEERDRYRIAVLREPASRGGSTAMHDEIQEGDLLQISAPKNHFPLEPSKRTLLFAGGIGVTPILCMAERLAHTQAHFEMHYCARSRDRMAFVDRIQQGAYAEHVHFYHDDQPDAGRLDVASLAAEPDDDTHIYVCGPSGFIDHVLSTCKAQGWPSSQLHTEYFTGAVQDSEDDESFEVKIASSGASFTVPKDKTVYEVLSENGVEIMVSCEQGVCGTCLTRVLEGEPDHRDLYLDDEEHAANDQFTPCCSRAKSKILVLDL